MKPGDQVEVTPLERWRQQHRVTLTELSNAIGASPSTVQPWLMGSAMPTLPAAYRIADVTGGEVPVSCWLGTLLGKDAYNRMKERAVKLRR